MIPIKSQREIETMRQAGRIAANILELLCRAVAPGVNTHDLDQLGRSLMETHGVESACYGYVIDGRRYPSFTCISINDEIVHGIGSIRRVLRAGDIVSIDVSVRYRGFIGDNARTVPVGPVTDEIHSLLTVTREALDHAIACARSGNRVGEISHAIEQHVRGHGFGVVREFVGHGVGRTMHEPPQIPNFGSRRQGDRLRPGMTLAIEPMVTLRPTHTVIDADGWTARTADRCPSAHFEHTVLITPQEPEILTIADVPS
jgi:methionyl aminopeptidase